MHPPTTMGMDGSTASSHAPFASTIVFYLAILAAYGATVPPARPFSVRAAEIAVAVLYGALSAIGLAARPSDRQVGVFTLTGCVVSLSVVLPTLGSGSGPPALFFALLPVQHLVFIGGPAVFIAMASLIPDPSPLSKRHPGFLKVLCSAFVALAIVTLTLHCLELLGGSSSPIRITPWLRRITVVGYTMGGFVILGLLGHSAVRARSSGDRPRALYRAKAAGKNCVEVSAAARRRAPRPDED